MSTVRAIALRAVRRSGAVFVWALLAVVPGQDIAVAGSVAGLDPSERETVIEIWKGRREMEFRQAAVIRRFKIALGSEPRHSKRIRGDGRTPVGQYYVADKLRESRFRRFLGINYPNVEDAEHGYVGGLITPKQWTDIFLANLRGELPPWGTRIGGRVGIHGYGGRPFIPVDWTEGCIAVSDEAIDYLYERVSLGTPVIINE